MKLITKKYFKEYSKKTKINFKQKIEELKTKNKFRIEYYEYYIVASSLYSSKIEGNTLDVNSFFRSQGKKESPKKKEVEEIENLMLAYRLASGNELNKENLLLTHALLSKTLLPTEERGQLRKEQVGIRDSKTMRPVYLAVEPEFLQTEFNKLFSDINALLERKLSHEEVFYFASMIHLHFAKIHPFIDGNGRAARLLEKWFLCSKLGKETWSINSEKYYWDNRQDYYKNIALGYNYYALYWERSIPFLQMLANALMVESVLKNIKI